MTKFYQSATLLLQCLKYVLIWTIWFHAKISEISSAVTVWKSRQKHDQIWEMLFWAAERYYYFPGQEFIDYYIPGQEFIDYYARVSNRSGVSNRVWCKKFYTGN